MVAVPGIDSIVLCSRVPQEALELIASQTTTEFHGTLVLVGSTHDTILFQIPGYRSFPLVRVANYYPLDHIDQQVNIMCLGTS